MNDGILRPVVGRVHNFAPDAFGRDGRGGTGRVVWGTETLDRFLTKPPKVVNGSFMNFTGLSHPENVANVIAYLATFSPPPAQ
jgi:cytochrome c